MGVRRGWMEKRRPHYDLIAVKAAFNNPDTLNRTYSSRQGADDLGIDDATVVQVIQGLSLSDFYKSMTSRQDHRIWQDVYKPVVVNKEVYLKVTLDGLRQFLLISFKEADDEQS